MKLALFLKDNWGKLLVLAIMLALLAVAVNRQHKVDQLRLDVADLKLQASQRETATLVDKGQKEEASAGIVDNTVKQAKVENEKLRENFAAAVSERDRLRKQIDTYRLAAKRVIPADSAAHGSEAADSTALDLFANLLAKSDSRAGEYSEIADDAFTRGRLCEITYDETVEMLRKRGIIQ